MQQSSSMQIEDLDIDVLPNGAGEAVINPILIGGALVIIGLTYSTPAS